jgi:membrane associated rhomboid family serine protease
LTRDLPPSLEAIHLLGYLRREAALRRWRLRYTRPLPPVTVGLMAAIAVIHLLGGYVDWTRGYTPLLGIVGGARSTEVLVAFGGRVSESVADGAWWRLVSCIFLHGDLMHLVFNLVALLILGRICEAIYGPARFLGLFLFSGICGSLLSHAGGNALAVGASGSVFGLMGAAIVWGLWHRAALPLALTRLTGRGLLPWALLNLGLGLAIPRIDNLGHLGGLLGGLLVGALLRDRVRADDSQRWAPALVIAAGSGGLLVWTFARAVGSGFSGL